MPQGTPSAPPGLAAFLTGLIDYAGLFPPARLPLSEAAPNFAAYRRGADAWMLGRFICPAARLRELAPYTDLFTPEDPFPVAALGTGGPDAEAFLAALSADLRAVEAFEAEHPHRVRADVLEVRLPDPVAEAGGPALAGALRQMEEGLADAEARFERVYVEFPLAGEWRATIGEGVAALARAGGPVPVGLKLRCGGLTPDAFPTAEQVAFVIAQCRDARLPFKATAGLHHPFRFHDRDLEVTRHGFVNVFGAAVLAHALDLSEAALRQVLRSEQPKAFSFDEGFAFQDLSASVSQVEAARRALGHSYGSCSFDEPRDDLRALGLL
jgi:hypothetical protein